MVYVFGILLYFWALGIQSLLSECPKTPRSNVLDPLCACEYTNLNVKPLQSFTFGHSMSLKLIPKPLPIKPTTNPYLYLFSHYLISQA